MFILWGEMGRGREGGESYGPPTNLSSVRWDVKEEGGREGGNNRRKEEGREGWTEGGRGECVWYGGMKQDWLAKVSPAVPCRSLSLLCVGGIWKCLEIRQAWVSKGLKAETRIGDEKMIVRRLGLPELDHLWVRKLGDQLRPDSKRPQPPNSVNSRDQCGPYGH